MTLTLQRLTAQGRALLQRVKPRSASVRNVLKLAGGTAGSQIAMLLTAPFLTRLYGPESFGILATLISAISLVNVVSSLRYELAIPVPDDDDSAASLVFLCLILVCASSALTLLVSLLFQEQLIGFLGRSMLKSWPWLLSLGVLFLGLYQPLSYWLIRYKHFSLLAKIKFGQSIFGLFVSFAAVPLGSTGLLAGQILAQSAGFFAMIKDPNILYNSRKNIGLSRLYAISKRFKSFALFSAPAGLFNSIGVNVPILMFASSFGASEVGQLILVQRLLLIPVGLIGGSVSQVFLAKAAGHGSSTSLTQLVQRVSIKLVIFGLIMSIFVCALAPKLILLTLGKQWSLAAKIAPLLIPSLIGSLSVSSVSMAFMVLEKNLEECLSQALQALVRVLSVFVCIKINLNFIDSVSIYSIGVFLGYALYWIFLQIILRKSEKISMKDV